jgi:CelD/BcsL family acetyltransferase involved in cellulose biosynthesis
MVCRDRASRAVGILPLYAFSISPVTIMRFVGHGPADHLGPICDERDRPALARVLRRALERFRPDLFVGERLSSAEGWGTLVGGRVVRREGSPVLRFGDGVRTWDDYLATRSTNLRQQLRRFDRKLAAQGLRYRDAVDADGLEEELDTLFRLHEEHWPGSDFAGRHSAFHREFARVALDRGWLRMWVLEEPDRPVAVWQGFRFGGVESYYQAGRVEHWDGPPLGLTLLAHSIRAALEDGVREYRFLRGSEPFKYRFATEDPGIETVVRGRGAVGSAAVAATAALPEAVALPLRRRLAA